MIEALGHQLKVYNYSSEKDKMFVPSRACCACGTNGPRTLDEYEIHSLQLGLQVDVVRDARPAAHPARVDREVARRDGAPLPAGRTPERAVRSAEFSVASHVGDLARAERAYTAWLAADRDTMADCHACELHSQGEWQAERGRDAEALDLWGPVPGGRVHLRPRTAHRPRVLPGPPAAPGAGRRGARPSPAGFPAHARPMESMRGAYADHVEFCALSGNEARGLELLAERPAYFTDSGNPRSGLEFLSVVTLLMDLADRAGARRPAGAGTGRPALDGA
ncbi:hypothetical protein ACRAWF_15865 [Streptomyces sp. L7]